MAILVSGGIERVSYQTTELAENRALDFPARKANLTIAAPIPSRVNEVFGVDGSSRVIENAVRPSISTRGILSPARFNELTFAIDGDEARTHVKSADDLRTVSAAMSLIDEMRADAVFFNASRQERLPG